MAVGRRILEHGVVAILLASLLFSGAHAHHDAPEEEAPHPPLYLRAQQDHGGSYRNFTTMPPTTAQAGHVEPCQVTQDGRARWCWQMNRSPEPWVLYAGAGAEAVLHLENLDRTPVGTLDLDDPTKSGHLRIDVIISRGSHHEAAAGHTYIEPPALTGTSKARIHVPLSVHQDTHWNTEPGDAPAVELKILVSGLVRRDLPPTVAAGGLHADSHIILPGFPGASFAQWERIEEDETACHQRLITQNKCTNETDRRTPHAALVEEAPIATIAPLLALGALAGLIAQRLGRTATTAADRKT